ncbi:helix-turn-helix domain-containing protein [Deinococcus sp. ME38]|uniref:helix-turn-helix domain-containing protein n=1 Tax=Deinococcus sp. ME38 TaxID=3400344 RepID=UPI003B5A6584
MRLDCIRILARRQIITLPDLTRQLGLPENTVWALLQTLLRREWIHSIGSVVSELGRAATGYRATEQQ